MTSRQRTGQHSSVFSSLALVVECDHALGLRIYSFTSQVPLLRHLSTGMALSGDEAVWMTAPILLALCHTLTGQGPDTTVGFCVELLGDVLMCCVIEMGLKFCFRRERPPYAMQSTYCILPGEWWSFPSGHTLRAAYLARRVVLSPSLFSTLFGPSFATSPVGPMLLGLWAVLVGWSRTAKGRHFPCDVAAGLIFGFLVAEFPLRIGLQAWCVAKLFAGSVTCSELAVMTVRPELRLEGFSVHVAFQSIWFMMQPFGLSLNITAWMVLTMALSNALVSSMFAVLSARTKSENKQ